MLKGRFETKLNRKSAIILGVVCLLGTLFFCFLVDGAGYGGESTAALSTTQPVVEQSIEAGQDVNGDSLMLQDSDSGFDVAMDVVLKLVIVIVLILALTKVLQYLNGRSRSRTGGQSAINIVESLTLAQNQRLYLIEVGEKAVLIGATANQLATLTEITDPTTLANMRRKVEAEAIPQDSFARYLQRFSGGQQSESSTVATAAAPGVGVQEASALIRKICGKAKRAASSSSTTGEHNAAI